MRHECIILADGSGALSELCGISLLERLLRQLQRLGLRKAIVLSATPDHLAQHLAKPSPNRAKVEVDVRSRTTGLVTMQQIAKTWPNESDRVLIIQGDTVFDSRLLQLIDEQDSATALVDSSLPAKLETLISHVPKTKGGRLCGVALLAKDWTCTRNALLDEALRQDVEAGRIDVLDVVSQPEYSGSLRRNLRAYWFPAPDSGQRKTAERVLLDAAQKGTQDFPALVHAPIENFLISHLWKTGTTPNQLTIATNIVAWGATFLFATGHLVSGTILALIVGVLDGLDGKQARIKVETSATGKLEHWFDSLFEISWWIAIAWYFQTSGQLPGALRYLLLLLCAEGAGGLAKLSVIRCCDRLIDELSNFDRAFRFIAGRRNIYVWILTVGSLFGTPAQAFKLMVWWGVFTAAVHVLRAAFAVRSHRKSQVLS